MSKLQGGDEAPDFELPDGDGKVWKLAELKGKKVILYFYPADDTPRVAPPAYVCDSSPGVGATHTKGVRALYDFR